MILSPDNGVARSRRARGWTQAELADRSQVSRTEVSAIETGRLVPSVAVALRLAAALGDSVETVFGGGPSTDVWAWQPREPAARHWAATVDGRVLAYPVELTAAGSIPHDRGMLPSGAGRPDRTLVIAGCDPLAGLLASAMATQHGIRVLPLLRSSGDALDLLRRGLVHAAGVHFTDAAGHSTNEAQVRVHLGPGYRLLHQVQWESGIAVAGARAEKTPLALLRAKVRWVNREEGSAARRAFDVLIASRPKPSGYQHVVRDHRAVAAVVSSGWAEAGICVKPAAAEAGVGFIPLQAEAYELCVAERHLDDPRISALIATLQSAAYRDLIGEVPGCVARETGSVRRVA